MFVRRPIVATILRRTLKDLKYLTKLALIQPKVKCDQVSRSRPILPYRLVQYFWNYLARMPSESIEAKTSNDSSDDKNAEHLQREKDERKKRESYDLLRESYACARKSGDNKWLSHLGSCHIYLYEGGGEPRTNLAAFDLDGTIIKPKSNKRIPRSATDWQFFSAWTRMKLQQAVKEHNSRFVIFTNQNGVGLNIVPLEEIQERIKLVTRQLGIPCTVFVATEKDEFRKPGTGMFKLFTKSFNDDIPIDLENSFYCGDAIGYPSHSDADIKFAKTLGLPFLPPDKFVRGVRPKLVPVD